VRIVLPEAQFDRKLKYKILSISVLGTSAFVWAAKPVLQEALPMLLRSEHCIRVCF
jgi:hypothetical protein